MAKKILIIKLGAMGDVVHTTIIATAIKQAHPDWQVDYLTTDFYAKVIENHPHLDNIIEWDASRRKSYKYLFETAHKIFKKRYDIIFNLTLAVRNNLLAMLAFPKKIINKKSFPTSWVEEYFLMAKDVIKDIELPERLYLNSDISDFYQYEELIKNYPRPHFVISPGGATDNNRQGRIWNIQNWKNLCEKLYEEYKGTVFVCGSSGELEKHLSLESEHVKLLTGKLNTKEMSQFISKADMFISGDTGPLHVASAHNIKTLAILGSTSPDKIKPYGENGNYISANYDCLYCWQKKCPRKQEKDACTPCMEALTAEEVFDKIKQIL